MNWLNVAVKQTSWIANWFKAKNYLELTIKENISSQSGNLIKPKARPWVIKNTECNWRPERTT